MVNFIDNYVFIMVLESVVKQYNSFNVTHTRNMDPKNGLLFFSVNIETDYYL